MADALLSPMVGGTMWAATAATVAHCARRVRDEGDDRSVPLMGVLGAFLFTAQMINFAIPGTGSSGHLGGGLLLAILLGPQAAFLVMTSVVVVQTLFFADGGLLALGCNVFNLGFFPAFVGYPLYRLIAGTAPGALRASAAAVIAAIVSMQLGALAVVAETVASGISALPFGTFVLFMLPIHLAIGLVEGLVTAAIVAFIGAARPEALERSSRPQPVRALVVAFLSTAVFLGGVGAWFASDRPDGLEWSIERTAGKPDLAGATAPLAAVLARAQSAMAPLPHYGWRNGEPAAVSSADADRTPAQTLRSERTATSVAGLTGGLVTLALALLAGMLLRRRGAAPGRMEASIR